MFTMISINGVTQVTTTAATVEPSVTVSKKTLYAGYETYKLVFKNLSKSSEVSYKSSKASVATVSKKGTITPITKGTATITVTVKQSSKTYTLKVKITVENPSIAFTSQVSGLNIGEEFAFKAKKIGMDEDIVWSVSDKTIATISITGKLSAKAVGSVTVYAKTGGKTGQCKVMIGSNRIGTFSKDIVLNGEKLIWINVDKYIDKENLNFEIENEKLLSCEWGEWGKDDKIPLRIIPNGIGETTITITSTKSTDSLVLKVTSAKSSGRDKDAKVLTAQEIYAKCGSSTVEILASDSNQSSLGSGFFIGDGIVVTNYHVIIGAQKIQLTTYDNKKYIVNSILGYDKDIDLAILSVSTKNDTILDNKGSVSVGEDVYAVGSPFGLTGTLTAGIVSTVSRVYDGVDYIQTSASISEGNSGGPLLNSYGEVIGINTWTYIEGQNLNFAVNINELYKINTNTPTTITEYYNAYVEKLDKFLNAGEMDENPLVSNSSDNCQEVPSGYHLFGSIAQPKAVDYYYFYVPEDSTFFGILYALNRTDLYNMWFMIYDINGNEMGRGIEADDYLIQSVEFDIPAGYYYIEIFPVNDYNGSEILYELIPMYAKIE